MCNEIPSSWFFGCILHIANVIQESFGVSDENQKRLSANYSTLVRKGRLLAEHEKADFWLNPKRQTFGWTQKGRLFAEHGKADFSLLLLYYFVKLLSWWNPFMFNLLLYKTSCQISYVIHNSRDMLRNFIMGALSRIDVIKISERSISIIGNIAQWWWKGRNLVFGEKAEFWSSDKPSRIRLGRRVRMTPRKRLIPGTQKWLR